MTTIHPEAPIHRVSPPNMFPGLRLFVNRTNGELRATKNTGAALIATVEKTVAVVHGADARPLNGRTLYMIHTDLGVIGWQAPTKRFGVAPFADGEHPPTRTQVHLAYLAHHRKAVPDQGAPVAARPQWHISRAHAGASSFLCPPGHPAHSFAVIHGTTRDPRTILGIESAANGDYPEVPGYIQDRARALMSAAELVESEHWLRMVYGYFQNCYMPEGSTSVDTRSIVIGPGQKPELSAAVLTVRRYFPHHEPRLDLLAAAESGAARLYGSHPCASCGLRVQYEAALDAYAVFERRHSDGAVCAKAANGLHSWTPALTVAEANTASTAAHAVRPWLLFTGLRIYVRSVNGALAAAPKGDVSGALVAAVLSTSTVYHLADGTPTKRGRPVYMIHTDLGVLGYQASNRLFALAPMPGAEHPATSAEFLAAHDEYRAAHGAA